MQVLAKVSTQCPKRMYQHTQKLKDSVSLLNQLPLKNTALFFKLIFPLFKVTPSVRDTTLLTLRKSMFSKDVVSRQCAVQGYLSLL